MIRHAYLWFYVVFGLAIYVTLLIGGTFWIRDNNLAMFSGCTIISLGFMFFWIFFMDKVIKPYFLRASDRFSGGYYVITSEKLVIKYRYKCYKYPHDSYKISTESMGDILQAVIITGNDGKKLATLEVPKADVYYVLSDFYSVGVADAEKSAKEFRCSEAENQGRLDTDELADQIFGVGSRRTVKFDIPKTGKDASMWDIAEGSGIPGHRIQTHAPSKPSVPEDIITPVMVYSDGEFIGFLNSKRYADYKYGSYGVTWLYSKEDIEKANLKISKSRLQYSAMEKKLDMAVSQCDISDIMTYPNIKDPYYTIDTSWLEKSCSPVISGRSIVGKGKDSAMLCTVVGTKKQFEVLTHIILSEEIRSCNYKDAILPVTFLRIMTLNCWLIHLYL